MTAPIPSTSTRPPTEDVRGSISALRSAGATDDQLLAMNPFRRGGPPAPTPAQPGVLESLTPVAPDSAAPARSDVSPIFRDYLRQQAARILARGGSLDDVTKFYDLELGPHRALAETLARQSAAPADPTGADDFVLGLSMRAAQGITFGFGDEVIGGLLGAVTGLGWSGGVDEYRRTIEAWSAEHGKLGFAAEVAGGLITGGVIARAGGRALGLARGAAPTTLQRTMLAAGEAGSAGALYAAGSANGGMSERAQAAVFGGTLGAVTGGVAAPVIRLGGAVVRPAVRGLTNWSKRIQERLPGVGTPDQHARLLLKDALTKDNLTLVDAEQRALDLIRSGVRPTLADVGGDATRQLAADAVAVRSPVKQQLIEGLRARQAEQGSDLLGQLRTALFRDRFGLAGAYEASDALMAARQQASRPLYEKAFQEAVPMTDDLRAMLQAKPFRAAYEQGRRIAAAEEAAGIGVGLVIPPLPPASIPAGLAANPQAAAAVQRAVAAQFPATLPVRGLDYMKRGLDVLVKRGLTKTGTMEAREAQALGVRMAKVLAEADAAVPAYGAARGVFKGFSEANSAITLGQEFLRKDAFLVRKELAALSPDLQDFYRLGASQSLYERVGGTLPGTDVAAKYFGGRLFGTSSDVALRVRALFPTPAAADEFMRGVAGHTLLSETYRRVARKAVSGTVQRAEQGLEGPPLPGVRMTALLTGLGAARSGLVRAQSRWTEQVSDALAGLFLRGLQSPDELVAAVHGIQRTTRQVGAQRALVGGAADRAAFALGQVLGTTFTQ